MLGHGDGHFVCASVPPLVWKLPLLSAGLPGIGGKIKLQPEDFEVEELPAYTPRGDGEHLFLWIEKVGVSGEQLIQHVADALGISLVDVGVAGLKDRRAVTRQFVSVPRHAASRIGPIDTSQIRVLDARPHTNKLRTGHLRGNRFRIVVRDVVADAVNRAERIGQLICCSGLANYFGSQRFGRGGTTAQLGFELLQDGRAGVLSRRTHRRFLRKLALSAAQAVLYNAYLARRQWDGLMHTVLDGEVMLKRSGGIFFVTDRPAEQARFDRRETVHAGPIYGAKMFAARQEAAAREAAVLSELGVTPQALGNWGAMLRGTRRANLVEVEDLTFRQVADGLEFRFALPAGSYATVLLAEFRKEDP